MTRASFALVALMAVTGAWGQMQKETRPSIQDKAPNVFTGNPQTYTWAPPMPETLVSEGFEDLPWSAASCPLGMSQPQWVQADSVTAPYVILPHGGSYGAAYLGYQTAHRRSCALTLGPLYNALDLSPYSSCTLTYWVHRDTHSAVQDTMRVEAQFTPAGEGMTFFMTIEGPYPIYTTGQGGWEMHTVDLAAALSGMEGTVDLAFVAENASGGVHHNTMIDDVSVVGSNWEGGIKVYSTTPGVVDADLLAFYAGDPPTLTSHVTSDGKWVGDADTLDTYHASNMPTTVGAVNTALAAGAPLRTNYIRVSALPQLDDPSPDYTGGGALTFSYIVEPFILEPGWDLGSYGVMAAPPGYANVVNALDFPITLMWRSYPYPDFASIGGYTIYRGDPNGSWKVTWMEHPCGGDTDYFTDDDSGWQDMPGWYCPLPRAGGISFQVPADTTDVQYWRNSLDVSARQSISNIWRNSTPGWLEVDSQQNFTTGAVLGYSFGASYYSTEYQPYEFSPTAELSFNGLTLTDQNHSWGGTRISAKDALGTGSTESASISPVLEDPLGMWPGSGWTIWGVDSASGGLSASNISSNFVFDSSNRLFAVGDELAPPNQVATLVRTARTGSAVSEFVISQNVLRAFGPVLIATVPVAILPYGHMVKNALIYLQAGGRPLDVDTATISLGLSGGGTTDFILASSWDDNESWIGEEGSERGALATGHWMQTSRATAQMVTCTVEITTSETVTMENIQCGQIKILLETSNLTP